jgi:hypothetical protein
VASARLVDAGASSEGSLGGPNRQGKRAAFGDGSEDLVDCPRCGSRPVFASMST